MLLPRIPARAGPLSRIASASATAAASRGRRSPVSQRRWAQVHDVRLVATATPSIADKYRAKLESKARAEGHTSVDELRAAYADRIREQQRELARDIPGVAPPHHTPPPPPSPAPASTPTPSSTTQPAQAQPLPGSARPTPTSDSTTSPPAANTKGIKPLSAYLNVELAASLPHAELAAIWRVRHASDPRRLCAAIRPATWRAMERAAALHPQFVLPLPREGAGAEMHFLQWAWDAETRSVTVLFTGLAEYKARGEWAVPHTTVTHYTELAGGGAEGDEGSVLMVGNVVEDKGVSVDDARWLVMCLQRFYGGWDAEAAADGPAGERAQERRKLVEWFGKGDERFTVEKLMEEAERLA